MAQILPTKSVYYNDVVLVAKNQGQVPSRKEVPNELFRCICSPMTAVVGESFTLNAAQNGISITIPRYLNPDQKIKLYNLFHSNKLNNNQLCFIAIGLKEKNETLQEIYNQTKCDSWLVDIAFGGVPTLDKCLISLSGQFHKLVNNLMIGNVASGSEFRRLSLKYKNFTKKLFIRCGLSGGSACATSDATGYGRGQITEIIECREVKEELNNDDIFVVADAGIKHSGYAAKAFGAGADYILMGRYWANSLEAETNVLGEHLYWGLASYEQIRRSNIDKTHSEGKIRKLDVSKLQPIKRLVEELWGGLSSAISFSGYKTLTDFVSNGIFEVKENSLPPKDRD